MNRIEENLYIALGKFIRVLRSFITSELFEIYGNDWEKIYTGHSLSSIKLMLQNIGASYGFLNFGTGNPMYTEMADEYRNRNLIFGEPMSKKSFCIRFNIIR